MTHTITIPDFTPVRTNDWRGRRWGRRHRLQSQQSDLIGFYAHQVGATKATGRRRVKLQVWGWPRGRLPDADAFDKCLLDSLVKCRLLTDDGQNGIEGRVEVEINRSAERTTVITLEDAQ